MSKSVISAENLPTVTAVSFIIALLAVALTVVNYQRTSQVAAAVAGFEVGDSKQEQKASTALADKIGALEARLAALEKDAATAAAPPPAEAEAPAEAAPATADAAGTAKAGKAKAK